MGATRKQGSCFFQKESRAHLGRPGPIHPEDRPEGWVSAGEAPFALELPLPLISIQHDTGDGHAHHPATGDWPGTVKPSNRLAFRSQIWVSPLMIS